MSLLDDHLVTDKALRVETLSEQLTELSEMLKILHRGLPYVNQTPRFPRRLDR